MNTTEALLLAKFVSSMVCGGMQDPHWSKDRNGEYELELDDRWKFTVRVDGGFQTIKIIERLT